VYDRGVDAVHFSVVNERAIAPIAALVAYADIAEPIVNAPIKAHVRTPVACMPQVHAISPAPISGRPKQPNFRRKHPGSWNPVIAIGTPRPISRRPNITRSRAVGLHVDRERRWRSGDGDADAHLCLCSKWQKQYAEHKEKENYRIKSAHE
jgi:hypothetical protein